MFLRHLPLALPCTLPQEANRVPTQRFFPMSLGIIPLLMMSNLQAGVGIKRNPLGTDDPECDNCEIERLHVSGYREGFFLTCVLRVELGSSETWKLTPHHVPHKMAETRDFFL